MQPSYDATILERFPRLTIAQHREASGTLWGTANRWIVRRGATGWERVARFPFWYPRDCFAWHRLGQRAARADKSNVYVNRHGSVLAIRGSVVYRLDSERNLQPLGTIQGDSVLHGGICEDPSGGILFGEYFMNGERGPVRLWRGAPDLSGLTVVHEFDSGQIRHVHGVFRDPYDADAIWVTTGDYAGECYLLRTRDGFRSIDWYGDGSQDWRAVSLFFTRDTVGWLTDSDIRPNHACRMQRATGTLEIGQPIPCSGWYGTTTTEGLHVAFTTVEKGPAIQRNESAVLVSDDAFEWHEVMSFKKDRWRPVKLFKYGVISCPSGAISARDFYISGEGLVGLDGTSVRLSIRAAAA